jgi:hypothetical protein
MGGGREVLGHWEREASAFGGLWLWLFTCPVEVLQYCEQLLRLYLFGMHGVGAGEHHIVLSGWSGVLMEFLLVSFLPHY